MKTTAPPPAAIDDPPTKQADGKTALTVREALHVLIAAATWFLFFYWWRLVLPQVRRDEAVAAAFLIAVTSLATAVLTAAWVRYNIGIFRRKGPRLRLTPEVQPRDADALGRKIVRPDDGILRASRAVVVAVDGDRKTIAPGGAS